jgi:hypothetical protein
LKGTKVSSRRAWCSRRRPPRERRTDTRGSAHVDMHRPDAIRRHSPRRAPMNGRTGWSSSSPKQTSGAKRRSRSRRDRRRKTLIRRTLRRRPKRLGSRSGKSERKKKPKLESSRPDVLTSFQLSRLLDEPRACRHNRLRPDERYTSRSKGTKSPLAPPGTVKWPN